MYIYFFDRINELQGPLLVVQRRLEGNTFAIAYPIISPYSFFAGSLSVLNCSIDSSGYG